MDEYCYEDNHIEYTEEGKFVVEQVKDHRTVWPFVLLTGADSDVITKQKIHDCQNNIYCIRDRNTDTYGAVIFGQRISDKYTLRYIPYKEVVRTTYFLIEGFVVNPANRPSQHQLCMLLVEYLADKNYGMVRYVPVRNESEDVIAAMEAVGFKHDNRWMVRAPTLTGYIYRY